MATKLDQDSGEVQVNTLLYAMGKEAEAIYESFVFDRRVTFDEEGSPEMDYDIVIEKFQEHFVSKRNVIHEWACFHKRIQKPDGPVEAYIRSLYELAQYCEFGGSKDEHIRDRLVIGISDTEVSEKLQLQPELSLEKAIQIARQSEQIKQQNVSLHADCAVDAMRQRRWQSNGINGAKDRWQWQKRNDTGESKQFACSRCNGQHGNTRPCPAKNKKCRKCNKLGHFEAVCQSKTLKEVSMTSDSIDLQYSENAFFVGAVMEATPDVIEQPDSENEWLVELDVNGSTVEFKIDTGADITVMSQAAFNRLPQRPRLVMTGAKPRITSPGGEVLCVGRFLATSPYKGHRYKYWVTVIKGPYSHNLLGRSVSKRMGLVMRVNAITTDLLNDVFGDIGLFKCEPVKIELKPDAEPYSLATPRRIPFPLLPKVEAELRRMLSLGIIEEVTDPPWIGAHRWFLSRRKTKTK